MIYRFAHCILDTQLYSLSRAGQRMLLTPRVFEVLCYLIAHRDRVVSKQELCEHVWHGLAISDATLESCMRMVRTSVGDSGRMQDIIQTHRGYGYRFVAAVDIVPDTAAGETAEAASPAGMPSQVSVQEQPHPASVLHQPGGASELLLPGTRLCRACQYTNGEEATFCAACGTRLRQPCSYCGQNVALPAAFCVACGQPLAPLCSSEFTSASAVVPWYSGADATHPYQGQGAFSAQRKPVTVLCCTVTAAAGDEARVDLDTLLISMQALHHLARDVVQQYGGWLHSLVGDHLLVMFGVPVVQEDHARRAVRAALALHRRVHELRECCEAASGAPLALRIGLYTGLVVESRWDNVESAVAVVGEVVSLAVGLQAQAEPGQILCSAATAHLVQETVRLKAIGPVQIAGRASPVTAHAVLSGVRRLPGGQHREHSLSPFVGREREMATLHALLARVEAGRGQVVGVVGEAGIGKSRLIAEFCRSLAGRRLTYLTARCLSYGSATPYLPLLDLLRHNCGVTEADGPEEITAKVHRSLQEVEMSPETWAPVFLPLLGVPESTNQFAALSPEARKARTLTAFTQLTLNGSRQRPLVLEIEDLHWIDASSEECLAAIVERMAGVPFLLLVTYRPGYRPTWIDKSYVTQVALQPLSSEDSLCVVQSILPTAGVLSPAMPPLLAKAEGNPLFLEELAQMVAEQGINVSSTAIPDTVQAVLMARIDRLPTTAKRLLQAAAVIGKDVPLSLLQAVTDTPEEAMQHALRRLQTAEFLYESYSHAGPVYTFKHVLTQEVTYQSLVRQTRQQYHGRIAQVLEERFPEVVQTQPEILAQHYMDADHVLPAISYWQRAGQHAVERSANVEAISHFTQGLRLLQSFPETPGRSRQELALQLALSTPLRMIKGHTAPEVEGVYTRACELSQQIGESQQQFSSLISLARLYLNRGMIQKAYGLAEQGFALAQYTQEPGLLREAHRMLGEALFFQGEPALARVHLEQALALYEAHQHYGQACSDATYSGVVCLAFVASTLWQLGYPEQAVTQSQAAITLAQRSSHAYSLGFALQHAALVHQACRETQRVQEMAEATIRLAREHGFVQWLAGGMWMRGWVLAEQGCIEEGIEQFREGMTLWQTIGTGLAKTHLLFRLAEVYGKGGQVRKGLCCLDQALTVMHASDERHAETEIYRLRGELLLAQGCHSLQEVEAAQECLHHALTLARQRQAKSLELRTALSLCRLWQQQGRRAQIYQLLAEMYAWFTEGFATPDLREAKALLDTVR